MRHNSSFPSRGGDGKSAEVKAQKGAYHGEAVIDGLGGRPRVLVQLKSHVVSQGPFIHLGQRWRSGSPPPAGEVQQIVGIRAQGSRREIAQHLRVEELVAGADFFSVRIMQTIRTAAGGRGWGVSQM